MRLPSSTLLAVRRTLSTTAAKPSITPPSTPTTPFTTMPAAAAPKKAPVTPRPSASVIILTKSDKLLLVHRPNHLSFPNAHVFPGGVVSASDPSAAFCAARETFEETGLLFTTTAPPPSVDLPAAQTAIHSNTLTFNTFLSTHSLTLPLATFLPWSTWTTPPQAPKRYRSQFFLAELPAWIDELAEVRGDGGKEVVAGSARFVTPREALRQAREGEIVLFPPQLYMITMLAEALEAGGRERVREVSSGEFGGREVLPKLARRDEKGRLWMDVGGGDVVVVELAEGGKGEPRAVEVIKGAVKGAKL